MDEEEELEERRAFSIEAKLALDFYDADFVKEVKGDGKSFTGCAKRCVSVQVSMPCVNFAPNLGASCVRAEVDCRHIVTCKPGVIRIHQEFCGWVGGQTGSDPEGIRYCHLASV